jgi:DNA-binding transcriptional ArsR family regulator
MGTTKDRIFSDATNEMAAMLRALGHPARFEIINLLKSEKTCCGVAIMNLIPLSQSTISKHLSELKNAAIITSTNKGNTTNYTLNENALKKIESYFSTGATKANAIAVADVKTVALDDKKAKALFAKRSNKVNKNLKKENYVFKHLLLKAVVVNKNTGPE